MNILLKKAVLSEKSMRLAKMGVFTFLVSKSAGKREIAEAVEEKFEVQVLDVKTANIKDRTRSQRSRKGVFVVPGFKKAIIKLKQGQKIGLFETEAQKVPDKPGPNISEKKSLLKGTKVKIEKGQGQPENKVQKAEEKAEKKVSSKKKGRKI